MINNYLDWAKRQRKYSIKMSIYYDRRFRENTDDFSDGFHKGLSMSYDYSGRNFKKLQKSLEQHIEYACTHSSPEVWQRFSRSLLS